MVATSSILYTQFPSLESLTSTFAHPDIFLVCIKTPRFRNFFRCSAFPPLKLHFRPRRIQISQKPQDLVSSLVFLITKQLITVNSCELLFFAKCIFSLMNTYFFTKRLIVSPQFFKIVFKTMLILTVLI